MSDVNRRSFIGSSAAAIAATGMITRSSSAGDANAKIRCAVIGVNGRGWGAHVGTIQKLAEKDNVEVVALCDPDEALLGKRAEEFEKKYGRKVVTDKDMRNIMQRDDVDVVCIATPNHWHALATIWGCQHGKDVYVEKPGTHNIFEGQKMIEAANKYKRIVQHGVQLRSSDALQEAVAFMKEGGLGEIYMARGLCYRWRPAMKNQGESDPPKTLDWDLWQGPAQVRPYSKNYVHYDWHWFWDYGNGDLGNQGVHETDMCLWGTGLGLPSQIQGMGGKFLWKNDAKETPEVLTTAFVYPEENKIIEFEVRPWITNSEQGAKVGNIFYGSEGYLVVEGYNRYKTYMGKDGKPGKSAKGGDPLPAHFENFFECVRSRDASKLNGPVETAATSSALAHLGNISYRLGRRLDFDPKSQRFVNDSEADAMLTRDYRSPFTVPQSV